MAYTLKATGPATRAIAVVAVDEDGTTIKEFVNGWTSGSGLSIHGNVSTGTASYRSSGTKSYFETTYDASTRAGEGIYFTTNPDLSARNTKGYGAFVMVMAGFTGNDAPGDSTPSVICNLQRNSVSSSTASEGVLCLSSTTPVRAGFNSGSITRASTSTTLPTDGTTKFTLGSQWIHTGSRTVGSTTFTGPDAMMFYGTEATAGSSISAWEDATGNTSSSYPNEVLRLTGIGGVFNPDDNASPGDSAGGRAAAGKYFLWAVFDDMLELSEYQAIHDDPFGTLFDSSGASAVVNKLRGPFGGPLHRLI